MFLRYVYAAAFMLAASTFTLAQAPTPTHAPVAKMEDGALKIMESEVVGLAEAMPADKYDFAPTSGEFKGVRTFGQQMAHIASVNYMMSAAILGEKCPIDAKDEENGPASLKGKDDIVKFMKESFAYAHKAVASLTDQNFTEIVPSPFGKPQPRGSLAEVIEWHSFDHYGQSVVYARMNGIIPPASRR